MRLNDTFNDMLSKHFAESLRLTAFLNKVQSVRTGGDSVFAKLIGILQDVSFARDLKESLDLLSVGLYRYQSQFQVSGQKGLLVLVRARESFLQMNSHEKRLSLRNSIRKKSSFIRRSTINKHSQFLEQMTSSGQDSMLRKDQTQPIEVPPSLEKIKMKCFQVLSLLDQMEAAPVALHQPVHLLIDWGFPCFILDCLERVVLVFDYEFFDILCKLQTLFFSFPDALSLEQLRVLGKITFQEVLGKSLSQGRFLWNNFRLALRRVSPPVLFSPGLRENSFARRLTEFCFVQLEVHFTREVRNQAKTDLMERKTGFIELHENNFFNLAQLLLVLALLFTREESASRLRYSDQLPELRQDALPRVLSLRLLPQLPQLLQAPRNVPPQRPPPGRPRRRQAAELAADLQDLPGRLLPALGARLLDLPPVHRRLPEAALGEPAHRAHPREPGQLLPEEEPAARVPLGSSDKVFLRNDSLDSPEFVLNLVRDVVVPDLHQFLTLFKGPPLFKVDGQNPKYLGYWTARLDYLEYLCASDLFLRRDGLLSLLFLLLQSVLRVSASSSSHDLQAPFEALLSVLKKIAKQLARFDDFGEYVPNLRDLQSHIRSINPFLSEFDETRLEILGAQKTLVLLADIVKAFIDRKSQFLKQTLENSLTLNYFIACENNRNKSYSVSESLDESVSPADSFFHFDLVFRQIQIVELSHGVFLNRLLRCSSLPLLESFPYAFLSLLHSSDSLSFDILEKALREIQNTVFYAAPLSPSSLFLNFLFITEALLRSDTKIDMLHSLLDTSVGTLSSNSHYPNSFTPLLSDHTLLPESSVPSLRLAHLLNHLSTRSPAPVGTPDQNTTSRDSRSTSSCPSSLRTRSNSCFPSRSSPTSSLCGPPMCSSSFRCT